MDIVLILLVVGLVIGLLWNNFKLDKEIKRNRILQAFIAGTIRSISDYNSRSDRIYKDEVPDRSTILPMPYDTVIENIDWELSKDQLHENYEKWLKSDRNLFDDKRYGGDGFNFMYLDLFDKKLNLWSSKELMTPGKKVLLSEEIIITEENVDELNGEIAMFRDLLRGDLDSSMFTPENIDQQFAMIFTHIRFDKLEEAKKEILSRYRKS